MIVFNGMSIRLGSFYASRLWNHIHCLFIFNCLCIYFLGFFFFFLIVLPNTNNLKQFYLTHSWGPSGYYLSGQSRPKSNGNDGVLQNWSLTIRFCLVSYLGHHFWGLVEVQLAYSKPHWQFSGRERWILGTRKLKQGR